MAAYSYIAKDAQGNRVQSILHAATRFEALSNIRQKGLTVLDLHSNDEASRHKPTEKLATSALSPSESGWKRKPFKKVPMGDLALFCRQLAISVGAGVPLTESLESIAKDVENLELRTIIREVVGQLHEGALFSEAVAKHGHALGSLFVPLVRAAEEAGSLPETLQQMADSLERSEELGRKLRSILIYPVFMIGFFTVVCVVMTLFVLPKFKSIFAGFEADLPILTRIVFSANEYVLHHFVWIAAALILLVGGFILGMRTPQGQYLFDKLKLGLPVLGPSIKKIAVAQFCRNLSIMVRGGVPITAAIETAGAVCRNKILEESLDGTVKRIIDGNDISTSLGADGVFPHHMVRMVAVGENTGELPEVLEKISDAYEKQAENSVTVAMSLAEPFFICFFGVLILLMVLAIYMPIFTVSSHA